MHKFDIMVYQITFNAAQEFECFKKELEEAQKISYVTRNSKDGYKMFKCQHDKAYYSKCENKRMLREPKSNRIKGNTNCPSFISFTMTDGLIRVKYCLFHSHSLPEKFLKLDPTVRNEIEVKLRIGIGESTVLEQVKSHFQDHLITLQDVKNIKNSRDINSISLNKNDKISCQLMSSQSKNVKLVDYGENIEIFIQTEFQKKVSKQAEQFGLDSTHCTTRYGFYLTTLHAIFVNQSAIPAAHYISSNEKQTAIENFLRCTAENITPGKKTLITDDYPAYTNAWSIVIGEHHHIQCLWHLEKNWRINLNKHYMTGE